MDDIVSLLGGSAELAQQQDIQRLTRRTAQSFPTSKGKGSWLSYCWEEKNDYISALRKTSVQSPRSVTHMKRRRAVKIVLFPKGFGSENASKLQMFEPTAGTEKIKKFIVDFVAQSGINSCPPLIVGGGIGGTADKATLLSKKALLRTVGSTHKEAEVRQLERELLNEINALGIGPAGLGGKTTALAVHIETCPTHIAGLPVAINISCHALRQAERIL